MPIVYVHGVANRPGPVLDAALLQIETFARRYAAAAISNDPDGVAFIPVVWGDLGAQLAWAGASRPRSQLLGMGAGSGTSARLLTLAENYPALHEIPVEAPAAAAPASGGLIGGAEPLPAGSRPPVLRDLTPDELADVLAQAVTSVTTAPANGRAAPAGSSVTLALIAADDVAHDPTTHTALAAAPDLAAEVAAVESRFTERLATLEAEQGALIGMGGPGDWGRRLGDRLGEIATRGLSAPGWAASRVLLEARGPLNLMVSTFLGDIIVYLLQRGTATDPGPIPRRLLSGLRAARRASVDRGGEPIVLLTHSMGGQIAYDTLTTFLPAVESERRRSRGRAGRSVGGHGIPGALLRGAEAVPRPVVGLQRRHRRQGAPAGPRAAGDLVERLGSQRCPQLHRGPHLRGRARRDVRRRDVRGRRARKLPGAPRLLPENGGNIAGGRGPRVGSPMTLERTKPGLWEDDAYQPGEPGTFALVVGVSAYAHLDGGPTPARQTYRLPQLAVSALTAVRFFD